MTATISQQAFWDLFVESPEVKKRCDGLCSIVGDRWDMFDTISYFPKELGKGFYGEIELRDGLYLAISEHQLHDDLIIKLPERQHPLEYSFYLAGYNQDKHFAVSSGQNRLWGSGLAPKEMYKSFKSEKNIEINVHMEPELFRFFMGKEKKQLPQELTHLVRKPHQEYYSRSGNTTPAMQVALQQILNCPYQGMMKRMYLESKVLELMVLLVEEDVSALKNKNDTFLLKPDDVERIHHAKEILLRDLENPPSLIELSRQVGLNDCTLKRGFRLVFNTTVFGYLHHHRLEQARKLLVTGEISISQASRRVGFSSRSYFATAFRKKFGINPKEFLIANSRLSMAMDELIG
ncbi:MULTISPECIES: helix-turn-helix transcriptional regulator [Nostoc]|uniref:Helix-turn-helix transcriptional regulator n=2 Tax=Nostoc TaxID=1177 RepID=A0ABR8IJI6_9NOSO|nr:MULTISPECIES: AraC family transcriptional regulator [Nostoc]MBD2566094.1 helix-turn-helix transcriptional regulator [Nostoc linckia FACHB-391]MBD2651697.1 helix-turn-helix transcriptional regulator [Nostoc foliaceum FACHB-393]